MIIKRLKFLLRHGLFEILKNAMLAIGVIWTLIEIITFLSPSSREFVEQYISLYNVLISAVAYGIVVAFPRLQVKRWWPSVATRVTVQVGNLFDQPGNIAIPSADFFDTDYAREMNTSLKSQLISLHFNDDVLSLDRLIEKSLKDQNVEGEICDDKTDGKKIRYSIGTTATIPMESRRIFITVINRLEYQKHKRLLDGKLTDMSVALSGLWSAYRNEGSLTELRIPVFGSGLTGIPVSFLLLTQLIILSFVTHTKTKKVSDSLKIIIHPEKYDPADMREIKRFLGSIQI